MCAVSTGSVRVSIAVYAIRKPKPLNHKTCTPTFLFFFVNNKDI